jgi:hypothetical protein
MVQSAWAEEALDGFRGDGADPERFDEASAAVAEGRP